MTEQHTCKALAIHCIDFRIQKSLNNYLESRFSSSYDRVAIAGGIKSFPLEQCKVSTKLHAPQTIVCIQHEDCGAYGGSKEFSDKKAEQKFQKKELQKAKEIAQEHFPNAKFEMLFVDLSGKVQSLEAV